jgi:protein disulfide-isomerase
MAYTWYIKPTVENLNASDISNDNTRSSESKMYFFYADWCPHCKSAKPEWDKFHKQFNNKQIGTYNIVPVGVDCSEGENPLIQEYGVDGYPTVILVKGDQRVNYDAKITYDNLVKYVEDVLQ